MTKLTVSIPDLIKELEAARRIATREGNAEVMISATMAKAKLLGLDRGIPQEIDKSVNIEYMAVDARQYNQAVTADIAVQPTQEAALRNANANKLLTAMMTKAKLLGLDGVEPANTYPHGNFEVSQASI